MLAFQAVRGRLKSIQKPIPKLKRGWALIRVRVAGICNTDVEILRGYHQFRGVPGHEFVGEVVEVAGVPAATREKWIGRRVAFAEYLAMPLENLHRMPANVSDEKAAFIEPLAAACEILEQIPIRKFQDVAVLGDGKLALLIAFVLKARGSQVTLYGKHENKMKLARRVGVRVRKVRGDATDLKTVKENFRLVVEATGSPTGLMLAQQMTEPRGTLIVKSTFHGAAPVETWPIVVKELTVIGSRCGPFVKAIALLREGKVDPPPLISKRFTLSEAAQAIQYAQRRGIVKVLLQADPK